METLPPGSKVEEPLGYALVTGASRGIGRALAVELARHGISVVLVARDLTRLKVLAADIKTCYGVDARCISADLMCEAEKVYKETRRQGLKVEMLINNAGISDRGTFKDMDGAVAEKIIGVNVNAATTMSRLYGRDMAERRRGRIVFLSSIMGAVHAGPNAAVYAATKAYEKSLSTSLAKEMEKVGVGVTCVMPGPVKTDFKDSLGDALCWKMPFYPRSAPFVASVAVRAMLKGDSQVTPGWQNRFVLKIMQPMLPPRMIIMMVEAQWNPLRLPVWIGGMGAEGVQKGIEGYRERTVFGGEGGGEFLGDLGVEARVEERNEVVMGEGGGGGERVEGVEGEELGGEEKTESVEPEGEMIEDVMMFSASLKSVIGEFDPFHDPDEWF